jgi:hypothetical protein
MTKPLGSTITDVQSPLTTYTVAEQNNTVSLITTTRNLASIPTFSSKWHIKNAIPSIQRSYRELNENKTRLDGAHRPTSS